MATWSSQSHSKTPCYDMQRMVESCWTYCLVLFWWMVFLMKTITFFWACAFPTFPDTEKGRLKEVWYPWHDTIIIVIPPASIDLRQIEPSKSHWSIQCKKITRYNLTICSTFFRAVLRSFDFGNSYRNHSPRSTQVPMDAVCWRRFVKKLMYGLGKLGW